MISIQLKTFIMKKMSLFVSILLISVCGFGQAQEGAVMGDKKFQAAAVIELPYPLWVENAAMADYLSKKGKSRGSDVNGFATFKNSKPVKSDSLNGNLCFKTERKNNKEKDVTVVSLLVIPEERQTNVDNLHYLNMDDAKEYLNGMASAIKAYHLALTIKDQETKSKN
jgi:hypothetical protein